MTAAPTDLVRLGLALDDLSLVQGAGGNVSVKDGAGVWIKASGRRLRDLVDESGRAWVPLDLLLRANRGEAGAEAEIFAHRPRPSLEALFHALPFRVVAHTHPIGVCLHACARGPLPAGLIPDGVAFVDVPYARPGAALARAVAAGGDSAGVLGAGPLCFILRNHGLLVAAHDVDDATGLTWEIERRAIGLAASLQAEPLTTIAAVVAELQAPPLRAVGRAAQPATLMRALPPRPDPSLPPLFPDAAVFGQELAIDPARFYDDELLAATFHQRRASSAVMILTSEHRRVLVGTNAEALASATEVLAAALLLERTLVPSDRAAPLLETEAAALVALPSERYRSAGPPAPQS